MAGYNFPQNHSLPISNKINKTKAGRRSMKGRVSLKGKGPRIEGSMFQNPATWKRVPEDKAAARLAPTPASRHRGANDALRPLSQQAGEKRLVGIPNFSLLGPGTTEVPAGRCRRNRRGACDQAGSVQVTVLGYAWTRGTVWSLRGSLPEFLQERHSCPSSSQPD